MTTKTKPPKPTPPPLPPDSDADEWLDDGGKPAPNEVTLSMPGWLLPFRTVKILVTSINGISIKTTMVYGYSVIDENDHVYAMGLVAKARANQFIESLKIKDTSGPSRV